jgi:vitamin B12 transporter
MFSFFKKPAIGLVYLAVLVGVSAYSQKNKNLDEVIVTANRFEQKQSLMGKVITVLDDSLLRANAGKSLGDLLNQQVGITVVGSQQPLGSTPLVYVRGARTGYTLILIDGIPVYDPSLIENNFDINFLPIDQLARVEILKGGQSTMHGSDAMAGVINIITKKNTDRLSHYNGSLSFGSYGTLRLGAGLNGTFGKTSYAIQTSSVRSSGFSSAYNNTGKGNFDNDGLRQGTLRSTVSHAFSEQLTFKLAALLSKYTSDLDAGGFVDDRDYTAKTQAIQVGGGLAYTKAKSKFFLNYYRNKTIRSYVDDSTDVPLTAFSNYTSSRYASTSDFAEFYTNITPNDHIEILLGADFRNQNTDQTYVSYSSFGKYEATPLTAKEANIQLFSGFGSVLVKDLSGFNLELGGRYNRHSTFGDYFTYTFNPYFLWNSRLKVLVNLSSSFKAPSLYQLYSPYGNKALKPETATTLDAGVQLFAKKPKDYMRVVVFNRQANDVVYFQSLNTDPYGKYINLEKQNDKGLEIDVQKSFKNISLSANYTYLTGELSTKKPNGRDTTYNNLLRRPKHAFNASINLSVSQKLNISTSLRAVSVRTDAFYNEQTYRTESVELKPYTTIDAAVHYKIMTGLNAFIDLRNIGNVEYFDLYGFNNRRFNFNIGFSWSN